MNYQIVYKGELYHYGVLGQRRNIRNYQNPDGSLTPLGRIHYGVGPARGSSNGDTTKRVKRTLDSNSEGARRAQTNIRNKDMGKFLSKKKEEREAEQEELHNRQRENDLNLARIRYKEDTENRVWEKKVDRDEDKKSDLSDKEKERLEDAVVKQKPEENKDFIPKQVETSSEEKASGLKPVTGSYVKETEKEISSGEEKKEEKKQFNYTAAKSIGSGTAAVSKSAGNLVDHFKNIAQIDYKRGQKSVDLSHLTDEEMNRVINRINLEQRYRDATSPKMDTSGYDKTKEVLGIIGDVALIGVAGITIAKGINDLRRN